MDVRQPVVSGRDAAELFEVPDGTFDAVSEFADDGIEGARSGMQTR
jgi:hypothetical protein